MLANGLSRLTIAVLGFLKWIGLFRFSDFAFVTVRFFLLAFEWVGPAHFDAR
jgi:hypothetical protein